MNTQSKTQSYMLSIIVIGTLCLTAAIFYLPLHRVDYKFLILVALTLGVGSRITLQIPRFKTHIAVSDTFIFFALLLYGGEFAVVLAAVEAFFSSLRFCNKKITIFFNMAAMGFSTSVVYLILQISGLYTESQLHGEGAHFNNFVGALLVIALTQFICNTVTASIYSAIKTEKPWLETWKTKYAWTFITYLFGAISAGVLLQLTLSIGFVVVIATFPVIFFIYLSYRMYLKNVEMATAQAEQAEMHAEILEKQSVALRESEERFRSAFNYAPIGIALVAPAGNWLKVNRALCEILGYTEEEFLATDFQSMLFSEDLGNTLVKIHELVSGKIPNCQMEQRYIHKDGETVWAAWSVSAASDAKSERPNLIFQLQDITDRKLAEEKLQYEATHDALTGLPNRSFFMSRLESALEKVREKPDHKVSILFIDLDRFKVVNDSLGHFIGDQLLVGIADRLRDCLRPTDIVARLGGDEFTILVEGSHHPREVIRIAERVKEKFAKPFDLCGQEVYSSASIGILHNSEKHLIPADMMRDADTAMYQAKRGGRSRHEVFDEGMHKAVKETLQLENDLRRAVERQELVVYYQPIHSLHSGAVLGFEALARWNHPEFGTLSPNKFIPLAEEIGLIDSLGEYILHLACSQMCLLKDKLLDSSQFILNVNLSCRQFEQPDLVQKIKQILDNTGFPPDKLKLEITESVFFKYEDKAVKMLDQLCELGIEINIDDFGTGYSNLSYLMQLPISTLKIDRSFIEPIKSDADNIEIVQTIVMLAQNLGMKVIAEGVETEYQIEQLKKFNCEVAQGYFFSRPMRFEDLEQFLGAENKPSIPQPAFEDVSILSTVQ
jgi:diguanylate cyclase (GGDEF)-like protein/PAS domain S-box-containing protein